MSEKKIEERSFAFALMVIKAHRFLLEKREFVMSKQFLRAGTSIGANVCEAQAAQSRKDFIAKMSIASKEARETQYWIRLLEASHYFEQYANKDKLKTEVQSIINIITRIVKTAMENVSEPNT